MADRDPTIVHVDLPAPMGTAAKIFTVLGEAFPGATVKIGRTAQITIPSEGEDAHGTSEPPAGGPAANSAELTPSEVPGNIRLTTSGEVAVALVAAFRQILDQVGAENFVTFTVADPETSERYEVELRRPGAKLTAAEKIAKLEEEIAELRAAS